MPADTPHPTSDWPVPQGCGADAPSSDEPLIGYECAMPWLQAAPHATDPTRQPWQGGTLG